MQLGPSTKPANDIIKIAQFYGKKDLGEMRSDPLTKEIAPELFHHVDLANAKMLSAETQKLCKQFLSILKNPLLSMRVKPVHFQAIATSLDELFLSHLSNLSSAKPKRITHYQHRQEQIKSSTLMDYLKDVIGLLNMLNSQMKDLSSEQYVEMAYAIMYLVDGWLHELEVHNLIPSELHRIILSFTTSLGSSICSAYEKIASIDTANKEQYYQKLLALNYVNLQNNNDSVSYYKANEGQGLNIFRHFVLVHAFFGHYQFARENLRKIEEITTPYSWTSIMNVKTYFTFALYLCLRGSEHYPEIIHFVEKAKELYDKKTIIDDHENEAELKSRVNQTYIELVQSYLYAVENMGSSYGLKCKSCSPNKIIYIIPPIISTQKLKVIVAEKSNIFQARKTFVSISKNELSIRFKPKTCLSMLRRTVDTIGSFILMLSTAIEADALMTNIEHDMTTKQAANTEVLSETLPAQGAMASVSSEETKRGSHSCNSENEDPRTKAASILLDENEIQKNTDPEISTLVDEIEKMQVEDESETTCTQVNDMQLSEQTVSAPLFKAPEFRNTIMHELNGAKGIFIAYNPATTLIQPKKLDQKIEKRYTAMLNDPSKASATNCNGFKWVSNDSGPCLVGKLSRESYRLFPSFKEINSEGQTAFLYGEIKNPKKGKKANRY
ncbi:MAG: hypothetical protein J0H47_11745 [Gammaproteobacteria bacterium]|nr:hypothetical protein [Gammaproteobacteria bacterium]